MGLSKASVFHHFKNSEALALALVDRCGSKYGVEYNTIASSKSKAPKKLRDVAKSFEAGLKKNRLCLLAALGSSQPTLTERLQDSLGQTAKSGVRILARIFEQGKKEDSLRFEGTSKAAAQSYLALLQGLQQLSRYSKDLSIFKLSAEFYIG